MIIGKILRFHVREGLLGPDETVDPERLQPLARLGGDGYAVLGHIFSMARPLVITIPARLNMGDIVPRK
jgi:hypothetical protein